MYAPGGCILLFAYSMSNSWLDIARSLMAECIGLADEFRCDLKNAYGGLSLGFLTQL